MNRLISIGLLLIIPCFSRAQINTRWFVDISKNITKNISLGAQFQVREQDFKPKLDRYMGVGSINVALSKRFAVSGNYRYFTSYRPNKLDYTPSYRYYVDLMYGFKPRKSIELSFRSRYQVQYDTKKSEFTYQETYLRNKAQIAFPSKSHFTPYLSADLFYKLDKKEFDIVRIKAGFVYKINKKQALNVGFFGNQKINGNGGVSIVTEVGYKFKL
jgi:Protein of unknown function (DUF2490)